MSGHKDGRRAKEARHESGNNGEAVRLPRPLLIPEGRAPTAEEIAANDAELEARRQEAIRLQANPKRRRDQVQCRRPGCGHWGCPCFQGTRETRAGIIRKRQCGKCDYIFETIERYISPERTTGIEEALC